MKFRTEVEIAPSTQKIQIEDRIFSIGSCFTSELNQRLSDGQLQTLHNPFGVIFNPYSIRNAFERIVTQQYYTEEELIFHNGKAISLDHHTDFDYPNLQETLHHINQNIDDAHRFLKNAQWIIITYGTSFIYDYLPTHQLVANCHKIPNHQFSKRLLTDEELRNNINKTIELLQQFTENKVQILFSISPVRHTKDGIVENQWSKAKLINALHTVLEQQSNAHYLPIYELLMDDLRDYRFYKNDMIHPSTQAVDYIFDKFQSAYFSPETQEFIKDNIKIINGLKHRPKSTTSEEYRQFLNQLQQKIQHQQTKVNFRIFKSTNL